MPELSIIIPVYNTPIELLRRCFSSIAQLEVVYEAVIIDDGSSEPTAGFCRQYAEVHAGFRCVRQTNAGVSAARNTGLEQARGRYVMFVDADDELLPHPLTANILRSDADLVLFDATVFHRGAGSLLQPFPASEAVDRELLIAQLLTTKLLNGPWAKLYKRSVLEDHHIRFRPEFVTGEDWIFVCDFSLCLKTLQYIAQPCYRYYLEDINSQNRAAKHPDKILDNQICRFSRRIGVAEQFPWTRYDANAIKSQSARELIENLFNTAADLLLAKKLTDPRKKALRDAVTQAKDCLTGPIPKKTQLKLTVIQRFPLALWPLAKLRSLYLKKK